MPRRPRADTESTVRGSAEPVDPDSCDAPDEADRPDLDARERGQSAQRKAAGPGPRPAPAAPSDDDRARSARATRANADDEEGDAEAPLESWGSDPCAMPPVDPT